VRNVEKLIISLLIAVAVAIPACSQKETKPAGDTRQTIPGNSKAVTTASSLIYNDLVVGTGPSPVAGKEVKVQYTGWLENGKKFDSSLDHGKPFVFTIGAGQVIPGWDEGVMTMKTGGKRRLIIPPRLGYGSAGAGGVIPPDATLIFEVELLEAAQ
jgi:FKBP-type peptidyl-prolyl cis-trans isomerase FkpA